MHILMIHIPAPVEPLEREERLEDPLIEAFAMGRVESRILRGGSTVVQRDGKSVVVGCDIEVAVSHLERGLSIIRQVLSAADAPPDTSIRQTDPDVLHRLGDG